MEEKEEKSTALPYNQTLYEDFGLEIVSYKCGTVFEEAILPISFMV